MNLVITGATKGLGYALAEKFASDKQGHTLMLCARNEALLQYTATNLQARYPRTTILCQPCDVGNKQSLLSFAGWIREKNIPIDVLINNAGQFLPDSSTDEQDGTLEKMMETNLYGAYYLTRALLPVMIQAGSGHIFNLCSIASLGAYKNGSSYSISKFALMGFTNNLREELKPHHIKVTAVYPGAFMSDSWRGSNVDPQRIMEAKDIADMMYAAAHLSPQACVEEIVMRPLPGDV